VQTISTAALLIVKKIFLILVFIAKASVIKLFKQYYFCIYNITVYILEITILNFDKKKNIFIYHKFLFIEISYLF